MVKQTFTVSFRCFFPGRDNIINHRQEMPLRDIPKWLEAYMFTHPTVVSISVKIWPHSEEGNVCE